jgi:N-acyl-D-amino-acid deacylase
MSRGCVVVFLALAAVGGGTQSVGGQVPLYDLLISGGTVVDGSGSPSYRADVAVTGSRIVLVSRTPLAAAQARRLIDARGLIVAPGFIDLHAHLDPILRMPDAESHVRQGVTLALGGPDGGGPYPFSAYLDSVAARPLGMNVAFLAGHNTIRRLVMGSADRDPTPSELERMKRMVAESMGQGAFGLSTGLRYIPGYYSKTAEVVALAAVAGDSGGIYTSHLREEGLGLIEGVAEALEVGRLARVPVVLTHHKAIGQPMWGKSVVTLAMVDSARRAGTDVMIDQYPYTASSTALEVLVPPWALAGGDSALRRRAADPVLRDSILRGIVQLLENDRGGGDVRRVQFASVGWDPSLNGRTLYDLVLRRGKAPTMENAAVEVLESVLKGGASMVFHVMDEGDVRRIMKHPQTMIASDGRLSRPGESVPHPRNYGTFPRVLGKYVREEGVLTLEEAVRKMTAMPAARLGLKDRGCIAQGCVADITIFDAARVRDVGTFEDPHHYPEGIDYVIVNGVPVVDAGRFTDARPGTVLRRQPGTLRVKR